MVDSVQWWWNDGWFMIVTTCEPSWVMLNHWWFIDVKLMSNWAAKPMLGTWWLVRSWSQKILRSSLFSAWLLIRHLSRSWIACASRRGDVQSVKVPVRSSPKAALQRSLRPKKTPGSQDQELTWALQSRRLCRRWRQWGAHHFPQSGVITQGLELITRVSFPTSRGSRPPQKPGKTTCYLTDVLMVYDNGELRMVNNGL